MNLRINFYVFKEKNFLYEPKYDQDVIEIELTLPKSANRRTAKIAIQLAIKRRPLVIILMHAR